jgi:hypothetical protein
MLNSNMTLLSTFKGTGLRDFRLRFFHELGVVEAGGKFAAKVAATDEAP